MNRSPTIPAISMAETETNPLRGRRLALGAIGGAQGGPRTYAAQILLQLRALPAGLERLTVLSDRPEVFLRSGDPPWMEGVRLRMPHPLLRPWIEGRAIPRLARRLGLDLYHGTKNLLPRNLPCPGIVTIHDLAPFRLPETFAPLSGRFLRHVTRTACSRARRVIAVSEATARDLQEILALPRERIEVIHNGVAEHLRAPAPPAECEALRQRLELRGPLVLCLGTIQPRKNQLALLRAFARVRADLPAGTTLLFAGRPGWKTAAFAREYERQRSAQVRWLRHLPDRDLPALYSLATLFVSPSEYEGFGLTLVEAMAQGLAVISLARSAIPEVVGEAGLLLEEPDPDLLAQALRELLDDPGRRARLGRLGRERAARFSWLNSARGHLRCYAQVLAEDGSVQNRV